MQTLLYVYFDLGNEISNLNYLWKDIYHLLKTSQVDTHGSEPTRAHTLGAGQSVQTVFLMLRMKSDTNIT